MNVCTSDHNISVKDIVSAVKHMKPGKHDGSSVSSDYIINAPPELHRHLVIVFEKLQNNYTVSFSFVKTEKG